MEDLTGNSPCVSLVEEIVEAVSPVSVAYEYTVEGGESPEQQERPCDNVKRKSNERERWRHNNVNEAFKSLSTLLPIFPITKRLKKKDILDRSIKYIAFLETLLHNMEAAPYQSKKKQPALYRPEIDTLAPNDTHTITLISASSPPPPACPFTGCRHYDVFSISSGGSSADEDGSSDYHANSSPISPVTQPISPPHDGANDWLADMLDSGYCY